MQMLFTNCCTQFIHIINYVTFVATMPVSSFIGKETERQFGAPVD